MSLPAIALVALGAVMLNTHSKPAVQATKQAQRGMTPGGHHLTRPTGPSQMWVDKPQNTGLRNDAKGRNPTEIDHYMRKTYMTEAATHPGVRLVAGKAFA